MTTTIMPMTAALLDAEDQGNPDFCRLLGAPEPADWPPEFHGPTIRTWMRKMLADHVRDPGFGGHYILSDGQPVGTCGFKGPPDADGMVEIGYSVIPSQQQKGHASAAITALLAFAFADPRVQSVTAQTIPSRIASQRTALAAGFILTNRRPDPDHGEILTYTILRS
jgi:[ribosomal protein S5]-alanine N-acetyltransferase